MTPENVVLQLKKNGTFDDLRKRLLSDFQAGVSFILYFFLKKFKFIHFCRLFFTGGWTAVFRTNKDIYARHDYQGSFLTGKGFFFLL
jgi:hypothetical protein